MTKEDFTHGLQSLGFAISADESHCLCRALDPEGAGQIQIAQLKRMLEDEASNGGADRGVSLIVDAEAAAAAPDATHRAGGGHGAAAFAACRNGGNRNGGNGGNGGSGPNAEIADENPDVTELISRLSPAEAEALAVTLLDRARAQAPAAAPAAAPAGSPAAAPAGSPAAAPAGSPAAATAMGSVKEAAERLECAIAAEAMLAAEAAQLALERSESIYSTPGRYAEPSEEPTVPPLVVEGTNHSSELRTELRTYSPDLVSSFSSMPSSTSTVEHPDTPRTSARDFSELASALSATSHDGSNRLSSSTPNFGPDSHPDSRPNSRAHSHANSRANSHATSHANSHPSRSPPFDRSGSSAEGGRPQDLCDRGSPLPDERHGGGRRRAPLAEGRHSGDRHGSLLPCDRHRSLCASTSGASELSFRQAFIETLPQRLVRVLTANRARVIDSFRLMDRNEDGRLSRKEFAAAMDQLEIEADEAEMNELYASMDHEGEGVIHYEDLHRLLRVNSSSRQSEYLRESSSRGRAAEKRSADAQTSVGGVKSPLGPRSPHKSHGESTGESTGERIRESTGGMSTGAMSAGTRPASARSTRRVRPGTAPSPGASVAAAAHGAAPSPPPQVPVDDRRWPSAVRQLLIRDRGRVLDLFRHWEGVSENGEEGVISLEHFKAGLYVLGFSVSRAELRVLFEAMGAPAGGVTPALPFRELRRQLRVVAQRGCSSYLRDAMRQGEELEASDGRRGALTSGLQEMRARQRARRGEGGVSAEEEIAAALMLSGVSTQPPSPSRAMGGCTLSRSRNLASADAAAAAAAAASQTVLETERAMQQWARQHYSSLLPEMRKWELRPNGEVGFDDFGDSLLHLGYPAQGQWGQIERVWLSWYPSEAGTLPWLRLRNLLAGGRMVPVQQRRSTVALYYKQASRAGEGFGNRSSPRFKDLTPSHVGPGRYRSEVAVEKASGNPPKDGAVLTRHSGKFTTTSERLKGEVRIGPGPARYRPKHTLQDSHYSAER